METDKNMGYYFSSGDNTFAFVLMFFNTKINLAVKS